MTATIIGSTGLIGNFLLNELLNDNYYDTVKILIRRPIEFTHPKLEKKIVDFNDSDSLLVALSNSDVIFCSIGTTQKKVNGDKDAYRKIDFDIPVNIARFSKMTDCEKFILVSSVGANSKSNNFYLKLKGEVEDTVNEIGLNSTHIMRPSLLLGDRKEKRMGEGISKKIMPIFSFLIPSKYKPIHGKDVAKAMVSASKYEKEGAFVYHYADMKSMIN